MDETERQRATREAKAQPWTGRRGGRFGLLSYLAAQGYEIRRQELEEAEGVRGATAGHGPDGRS